MKEKLRFPQIFLCSLFCLALVTMGPKAQHSNKSSNTQPKQIQEILRKAEEVYKEQPQVALRLLQQITIPNKLPENQRGDFYLIKAKSYQVQNKSQQCITEALKAEEIMTRTNDSSGLMSCYILKGNAYYRLLALTASAESYLQGMQLARKLGRTDAINAVTLNLGNLYAQQKDWIHAKRYYQEALTLYKAQKDPSMVSYVYNNLGVIAEMTGKFRSALSNYNNALQIDIDSKDTLAISSDLCNISEVYSKTGRFAEALRGYRQSLWMAKVIQNNEYIAQILSKKAECLHRMGGSRDSITAWCTEVIKLFEAKACDDLLVLRRAHALMAEVVSESSNPRQAGVHFKAWRELDSLIMAKESDQRLLEIQASYNSEHLQRQTDQLAFEKSLMLVQQERLQATNMALIVSILLVIMTGVLVYVWKKPSPS
ncbi:MAG: tetratricopeptide repeat protein, partial [Cytophagia bacterium]|nr:tetratricopeptide repeat protein [Cytophagia bacterium]